MRQHLTVFRANYHHLKIHPHTCIMLIKYKLLDASGRSRNEGVER